MGVVPDWQDGAATGTLCYFSEGTESSARRRAMYTERTERSTARGSKCWARAGLTGQGPQLTSWLCQGGARVRL